MARKTVQKKNIPKKKAPISQLDLTLKEKLVELIEANKILQSRTIDLIKSNTELTRDIKGMVNFFKEAGERMTVESEEEKLRPLFEKLNVLLDQNKTVVRGLLLIQKYIKASSPGEEVRERPLGPEF